MLDPLLTLYVNIFDGWMWKTEFCGVRDHAKDPWQVRAELELEISVG